METFQDFHSRSSSIRSFVSDENANEVFDKIIENLSNPTWLLSEGCSDLRLAVFRCLRLLLRDENMLKKLLITATIPILCQDYVNSTQSYLRKSSYMDSQILSEIMVELTNILQKLSHTSSLHELLIKYECHSQMMMLLSCSNQLVFQSSLMALINLCKTETGREAVVDLCPLYTIMDIIAHYDFQSQLSAGDLFILLSLNPNTRQQIKDFDLLPNCISLIQSLQTEKVKQKVFKALQKVLVDEELLEEFRVHGGIPILVKAASSTKDRSQPPAVGYLHSTLQLLCTLCVYDPCAKQVVECNGVFHIACHLVGGKVSEEQRKLNADVLRTLRYLFSLESNRRILKRLFPTHIFEAFIDVGHYEFSLDAYSRLCIMLELLSDDEKDTLQANISSLDKTKEPIGSIGGYLLLEELGSGAYGVVYRVTKGKSSSYFAMKEISATHPALGGARTQKEKAEKAERIISEVAMTQKNLSHPNIVKFHKCFQESQNIYIVMNLIDGAPLSDYITSLKEKSQAFSEGRIWNIFTQIVLGLHYLHEEKQIVHRDLKPGNMILGEKDKVTITDFGLAKEHREFSVMKSMVGTMLYWCPELVQSEPYDKKADIWAVGCILFEMAALVPAFSSTNMLILAKKISEADYDQSLLRNYSDSLGKVVGKCLCIDPIQRPDSIQVGSLIIEHVMNYSDVVTVACESLERKLSRERERSLRHKQELLNSLSRHSSSRRQLNFSSRQTSSQSISNCKMSPIAIASNGDSVFFDQSQTPSHYLLDTDISSTDSICSTSTPSKSDTAVGFGSRRQSFSPSTIYGRRGSASALSISSTHLKEIMDPVQSLLTQIHKLVYVSQLPPTPKPTSCYLIVLQYKKSLFDADPRTDTFKSEIQKLSDCLNQPIISFPPSPRLLLQAIGELKGSTASNYAGSSEPSDGGVLTYELLHAFIEDILESTGYYKRAD